LEQGSLRRKAQWLRKYPEYKVENLRGNVQKRLQKLETIKLDRSNFCKSRIRTFGLSDLTLRNFEWMISAPAQGIVGVANLESNTPN